MALEKMKIGKFEVQVNPETITHNRSIVYDSDSTIGANLPTESFKYYGPEEIQFELILDGSGVVPKKSTGMMNDLKAAGKSMAMSMIGGEEPDDINDQLEEFENEVFDFDGGKHAPKKLTISWGSLFIKECLIERYDITYTLFAPNGNPIRAKLQLKFKGTFDRKTRAKLANTNSPDLTHIKTVRMGDALFLMCNDVYESPKYYLQIAKENNIINFRTLKSGNKLIFPPLER